MQGVSTPTDSGLPLRPADFSNLSEALGYAAQGKSGCNFYSSRGKLSASIPYSELQTQVIGLARRLVTLNLPRGSRMALVADTTPDFLRFFFACQYAGLVPVPLPVSIHLGGHESYVKQLSRLLLNCQASLAVAPNDLVPILEEAAHGLHLHMLGGPEVFASLPEYTGELMPLDDSELAYIQYTSGSTRWPRGVEITQKAVLNNLLGIIQDGLQVRSGDRCVSWLPFYHDMGLVGFVLGPVASQLSVDYLSTRDFAMRPRQWLNLMTQSQATISFSPSFGYELCWRRLGEKDHAEIDLSHWRVAGVGAETVRGESLIKFAEALKPNGFNKQAFVACYGMAECSLAVSFAPLDTGLEIDRVDSDHLALFNQALPVNGSVSTDHVRTAGIVSCGKPLPGTEVEVRNEAGQVVPDRHCGTFYVKSPGVMTGYFADPIATQEVLSADGWLNTGDIGYRIDDHLVIIGREKDLIIINGRNIWPQDLEYLAEQFSAVRVGDASAFSAEGPDGKETAVVVVQCRESDQQKREQLVEDLRALIYQEVGTECFIELIPPRTLPRTSSGKLSRARAREDFLKRVNWDQLIPVGVSVDSQ